jgi:hypothetical protein
VVDREGRHRQIERPMRQWILRPSYAQIRVGRQDTAGRRQHLRALVETDQLPPSVDEALAVEDNPSAARGDTPWLRRVAVCAGPSARNRC